MLEVSLTSRPSNGGPWFSSDSDYCVFCKHIDILRKNSVSLCDVFFWNIILVIYVLYFQFRGEIGSRTILWKSPWNAEKINFEILHIVFSCMDRNILSRLNLIDGSVNKLECFQIYIKDFSCTVSVVLLFMYSVKWLSCIRRVHISTFA